MDPKEAVERILALRELTETTGTRTTKTQGGILQALSPADLTTVAMLLKQHDIVRAVLSGKSTTGGSDGEQLN